MKSLLVILSILLLTSFLAIEKRPIIFKIENDYGLVDYVADTLSKPQTLNFFFTQLTELSQRKIKQVSIIHIGDSHIQADWLTGRLRTHFQNHFGNAGRGLIFPARVAKSNESASFISSSGGIWESKRVVFPDQPLPIGISGLTLRTLDSTAHIRITLNNGGHKNSHQRKASFFFKKDSSSYLIQVSDSSNRPVAYLGSYTREAYSDFSTIYFPSPTRILNLQIQKTLPEQSQFTLYGINLENNESGILYHSIGVNGAKFKHFLLADPFFEQLSHLNPDLIIISLGTNESQEFPYKDQDRENHVEELISKLAGVSKNSSILVTIPPGHFRNRNKKNPGVEDVLASLMNVTAKKKVSVFNLYQAGGGKNFANQWSKKGLIQPDGVHFTKEGYELQGDMLYLAIINAFNQYGSN